MRDRKERVPIGQTQQLQGCVILQPVIKRLCNSRRYLLMGSGVLRYRQAEVLEDCGGHFPFLRHTSRRKLQIIVWPGMFGASSPI